LLTHFAVFLRFSLKCGGIKPFLPVFIVIIADLLLCFLKKWREMTDILLFIVFDCGCTFQSRRLSEPVSGFA